MAGASRAFRDGAPASSHSRSSPSLSKEPVIYHTLRRGAVQHRIDADLWLGVLDLAAARGWTPVPSETSTPTLATYSRPSGATISAEDGQSLARCIEAGLPAIDDEQLPLGDHAFGEEHTEAMLSRRVEGQDVSDEDVRAAREILSGAPKKDAQRLATFLKGGEFSVDGAVRA